jgi:hypothetical protein
MSEAKTPKTVETAPKKNESTKTESPKSETTSTDAKPADTSTPKSGSSPKSAAQSSISHFSSVSTPQYRSGWNNIFGGGNAVDKTLTDDAPATDFPKTLEIFNDEVEGLMRKMLDEAFIDLAKKHGIDVDDSTRSLRFEYNINCEIKEK